MVILQFSVRPTSMVARADIALAAGIKLSGFKKPLFFTNRIFWSSNLSLAIRRSDILQAAEMNGSVAVDSLAGDSELERALARRAVGVRRFFRD